MNWCLDLFLESFSPFLKAAVVFTCLKTDENSDFLKQAFNLECKISVSISGVLLRVFVRTSVP